MKTTKNSGQAASAVLFTLSIIFVIILVVAGISLTTVDAGQIGVRTQFGRVTENSVEPGLHFVNPIGGHIIKYDVREQKADMKCPTYTKDMQQADIQIVSTYALNKADVGIVHQTFGTSYADKVVLPKIVSAVKDVIGNIEAAALVNAREKAAQAILENATAQIAAAKVPVTLTSLVIANIDYSDAFEKSIEEKVIAQQNAIREQNKTKQIEEESRQAVIRAEAQAKAKVAIAEADAKAVEIQGKALKENKDVVLLEAIKKWNGVLPTTFMGDTTKVFDTSTLIK